MRSVNTGELPDQTLSRIKLLIEHSSPNPQRPRLSDEAESRLADCDRRSAITYAEMEETTFQIYRLAEQIREKHGP